MDLYQAQIVDLAKNPIHKGELKNPTVTHSGVNVTCGDHVRLYLNVKDEKVTDAKWDGEGCAISIAAACLLIDELKGMKVEDAKKLTNRNMFDYLGIDELGPARVKCAVLCLETLQGALLKIDGE